jgi:4-hydroxy-4-methyl-2-oxoglutarate aldolase
LGGSDDRALRRQAQSQAGAARRRGARPIRRRVVHEPTGRVELMKTCMRPIYPDALISGTAVTVLLHTGDNCMMHVAAEQIELGEVLCYVLKSAGGRPLA